MVSLSRFVINPLCYLSYFKGLGEYKGSSFTTQNQNVALPVFVRLYMNDNWVEKGRLKSAPPPRITLLTLYLVHPDIVLKTS